MTQQTHTGFQVLVNNQPAPAEAGDFYGVNPRTIAIGGPGQFVAPSPNGLTVGRFCWVDTDTGAVSQSYVPGYQLAFLKRGNNAIIVNFLAPATYQVLQGLPLDLFTGGDFWAKFAGGATPGAVVYADPDSGDALSGPTTTASITASIGASFTGAITTNVLTASAVTGLLTPGDLINGTSVVNAVLGAQLTGTPGGAGTYTCVHADQVSEAMTGTSTVLDVTAVASGVIGTGDVIVGAGITTGTQITGQLSGTPGGVGTYSLSGVGQHVATAETVTVAGIATPFIVNSVALAGELAKISSWG